MAAATTLAALRRRLATLEAGWNAVPDPEAGGRFGFGHAALDDALGGGLARGALHEVLAAEEADGAAATGFVAGLLVRAVPGGRAVVWARQDYGARELGEVHPPGLAALGLDPDAVIQVQLGDATGVLRAGAEALRCGALGAVVIEPWGMPAALDLTASRRLMLAAARSGVTAFLLRIGARPAPSAALTRWAVRASASRPLAAGAPGRPAFEISLLRHRAGAAGASWSIEWDGTARIFREPAPLSGGMAAAAADRPSAAQRPQGRWRRAG